MAFDYEGAKREGYSDAEIAEHLSKKSGFKLDAARKEGYADADIIKHLVSKESKSNLPSMFPSFEQPPAEIPQSKLHMAGDFLGGLLETPANLAGQGIGVIAGGVKAAGNSLAALAAGVPVGEAAGEGFHSGMNQARTITGTMPETFTGQRFDETMGDLFKKSISGIGASYEKLKRAFDLGLLEDLKKIDPNKYKEVYDRVHTKSGQARSLIEGLTESSAIALGAKSSGTAISKGMTNYKLRRDLKRDTGIREAPPAPETPRVWEQVEQAHAPLEGTVRAPQYGMGEVPSYIERDMFGQPEIRPPVVERPQFGPENLSDTAAIDAQTPRSPFTRQDTPPQLDKMNRAGQELPVDPNRPFYGDPRVGMTRELPDTRYDLSRTPVNEQPGRPEGGTRYQRPENDVRRVTEDGLPPGTVEWDRPTLANKFSEPEIPGVPFEGNRPFFGREDFAATTGWQVADARVAEAIAGDSYLKGMQTRLAKMEENLKGIGEMQSEVAQRYGQRRIGEGGSGQQIGRELVSYTKSMKAVEKDIAALREKIDSRVKMHEERVRKEPKFEKTIDPFKKGPGRRQRGAINPEVFREGFQKAKDLAGKGLRLMAYATRDEYGPVFRVSARKTDGTEVGSADFIPTRGGLKRLPERDLLSALTEVDPQYQRQGVATEMYKFAHELGNDVVPSTAQTVEGKAMWDGFKAKRVPLSQRGAVNFGVSEKIAGMIDKLRAKRDSKSIEVVGKLREGRDAILNSAKGEERMPTQALKELGPDKIPELPTGRFQKGLRWWSNAQMVFNETKNPWVKYIADFASNAKAEAILYHELLTKNISFGKGRLPTKIIDPNSPHGLWNRISQFDRRVLTDIINKYNGIEWPSRDTIIAMGGKEKHAKMLETLQKPLNDLWKKINDERALNNKPPMPYRPFYFMKAQGFGPFLVRIKDAEGTTVAFHRMETKFGANKMAQDLKKQFEGEGYTIETDVANRATRGNKYNVSTTLLEEIYGALDKADPRREAITSAIADIKSKGGFGAHAAKRRDVKGMDLSPENFWKTYDSYIKDGSSYVANQKLLKAMNEIELMKEIPPELRRWSLDHLNLNRGGKVDGLMADVEGFLDSTLGAPGRTRITNDALSRAFLTSQLLFWRPPFLIASSLQSTGFAPFALSMWKYEHGYSKGSITKAFVEGSASFLSKKKEYQSMLQYLAARGKLDPSLVADLSLFGHGGSKFSKWMDHISGSSASKGIEMLGRMHSAAIGMSFLKQNGLKGKELRLGVERFVDDVMGNYSMTDRPGFVQRTGIVGELMKPLSTFQNYFYGSTILSLKHAIEGMASGNIKRAIPFVTLWGSMALLGGLLSAPFMKEMDKLFSMLKGEGNIIGQTVGPAFRAAWKQAFGETLNEASPSMEERILRSNLPDYGTLGVITGATKLFDERGIHLGGSIASPEMMPSAMTGFGWKGTFPGVGFGVDLVSALTTILSDLGGSDKTVQEKRKAYKTHLPGIFDKMLENYDYQFQAGDGPFSGTMGFGDKPVPGGTRGYGTVRRDGFETMASIIGAGTIPEVKEKAAKRDIKEMTQDLTAKKARLVDLGIDAIQSGNTDQLAQHMQKAIELGFQDYVEAVQSAMMRRMTTEKERARFSNPQQIRQWEYVEEAGQSR